MYGNEDYEVKKTGFIFFSNMNIADVTTFALVSRLIGIQHENISNIGFADSDLDMSVATVDPDDITASSLLIGITTSGTSAYDSDIKEIMGNLLGNEPYKISKPTQSGEAFVVGVGIGEEVPSDVLAQMEKIIEGTTTFENVKIIFNSFKSILNIVDNNGSMKVVDNTEVPEISGTISGDLNGPSIDNVVEKVLTELLTKNNEVQGALLVMMKGKEEFAKSIHDAVVNKIEQLIPNMIKEYLDKNDLVLSKKTEVIEDNSNITSNDPINKAIDIIENKEIVEEPVKNPGTEAVETPVYNKLTLDKLIGGCENDIELFKRVMENKNELSIDDLENVATYDMLGALTTGEYTQLGNREKFRRRNLLGL